MQFHSYLQPPEDLAPALVAGCGDQGLEDVAARRVGRQSQEVSGAQAAQAAEQERTLFKLGQSLDQTGAMVTDGGQWDLEMWRRTTALYFLCFSTSAAVTQLQYTVGFVHTNPTQHY